MQILKQIQIPYSFAKRHGVLLRYEGDQIFMDLDETLDELTIDIKKAEKPRS